MSMSVLCMYLSFNRSRTHTPALLCSSARNFPTRDQTRRWIRAADLPPLHLSIPDKWKHAALLLIYMQVAGKGDPTGDHHSRVSSSAAVDLILRVGVASALSISDNHLD
ncbi:hypothetical protein CRG98_008609 [Punica granatum]|uniref:Uncharacterized protein n=1 Tax=Punica granatum TaxID=22663 RepID=A0A2I0KRA8_PUNGR|nr:hypothetical protein CRG98_008609 [Punica granatum]